MVGRTVGNYRIVEKLGEGGMGSVYRGIDQMVERNVAIKVLKPGLASNSKTHERFLSEAKALAKLNHPAIAMLYSFFLEGEEYFMVMEYVPGQNLESLIRTHGAIRWPQAASTVARILDGIGHAHAQGIIHRDLKPANVMLSFTGDVKITDFGIARVFYSPKLTRESRVVGTMEYLAPERALGKEADERTDIYALGVILYEMLTGRLPFEGASEYELIRAQVEQMPKPLEDLGVVAPPLVEQAMMKALAKDPAARQPDAATFTAQLRAAIAEDKSPALRPMTSETIISETIQVYAPPETVKAKDETLPLPVAKETPLPASQEKTAAPPVAAKEAIAAPVPAAPVEAKQKPVAPPKKSKSVLAVVTAWPFWAQAAAGGGIVLVVLAGGIGTLLWQQHAAREKAEQARQRSLQAAAAAAAAAASTQAAATPVEQPPATATEPEPPPPVPAPAPETKKADPPRPATPRPATTKATPVQVAPDASKSMVVSAQPEPVKPEPAPPVAPPEPPKAEPAPPPTPVPTVQRLADVKSIYLSPMPEKLDARLRQELENEFKGKLRMSADASGADAVMNVVIQDEKGNRVSDLGSVKGLKRAVATISDRSAGKQLWTATVDDKHNFVSSLGDDVKRLASRLAKRLHTDFH